MTLSASDLALDYQHVDGTETVSVLDVSATATDSSVTALKGRRLTSETGGPVALPEVIDAEWILYAPTMSFTPSPGDVITDSSSNLWTIYTVQTIRLLTVDYKHVCGARKQ